MTATITSTSTNSWTVTNSAGTIVGSIAQGPAGFLAYDANGKPLGTYLSLAQAIGVLAS